MLACFWHALLFMPSQAGSKGGTTEAGCLLETGEREHHAAAPLSCFLEMLLQDK